MEELYKCDMCECNEFIEIVNLFVYEDFLKPKQTIGFRCRNCNTVYTKEAWQEKQKENDS